jgi:hypothetical protein
MMSNNSSLHGSDVILIKKASGEEEPFDTGKLERSLRNAGATEEVIGRIVEEVQDWIYTGVSTKKIYSHAFQALRRKKSVAAMRYKLKVAMLELGPTGYPFEDFIGMLFERQGYDVRVGEVVEGHCVTHEMDVIATRDHQQHLVECKYHPIQGNHVSVQVPLYVHSRVEDIVRKRKELPEYSDFSFTGWVVTNTRFSEDSLDYGQCSGLNLLGWDHPRGKGLKDLIEKERLYPVTVLHNLTRKEKQQIIDKGIVVCSQLLNNPGILDDVVLNRKKYMLLLKEITEICG